MTTYLIKLGELTLKGDNRAEFDTVLRRNLCTLLRGSRAVLNMTHGRFFVHCEDEKEAEVESVLNRLIGIAGWAKARPCAKTMEAIACACIEEGRTMAAEGIATFKIEARRADKAFPFSSYEICAQSGAAVLDAVQGLRVDVKQPGRIIEVEVRERAYIYGHQTSGLRGLPPGSAGRGMLLLSGGIDSPVAGYRMARRGMRLDAVYFHAYPYTSQEAQRKVAALAAIIGGYSMGIRLATVPFTEVQLRIKERSPTAWSTILLRMAMMESADRIASMQKNKCLITGESLSQVASQTVENIQCTEQNVKLPIFRPLIGTDKNETIDMAKKIGTYATSILPYADCCSLFSPPHPILKGSPEEAQELYRSLELEDLMAEAIRNRTLERCGFPG